TRPFGDEGTLDDRFGVSCQLVEARAGIVAPASAYSSPLAPGCGLRSWDPDLASEAAWRKFTHEHRKATPRAETAPTQRARTDAAHSARRLAPPRSARPTHRRIRGPLNLRPYGD